MKAKSSVFLGGALAVALGLGILGVVGGQPAKEVGATDTVITINSTTWEDSSSTDARSFTLDGVSFTCSGIKNSSTGSSNYGYLMNNGGELYNTSFPTGTYVSNVKVTYTSGTGTKGATIATFGAAAISTRSTSGGTTVVKSGSYSLSNSNESLTYFNLSNTATQNAQWDSVVVTFSAPSSNPKLTLSAESLAVNKGGTGSVTAIPANFTADHYVISSSDATIATGAASGNTVTVSGLKAGTATLTIGGCATAGSDTISASASLAVTVNAQSVKVSPATTTLYVGGATKNVTLTPEYFNGTDFLYDASSSNTAVATVAIADTSIGAAVITPVGAGTATVTYTVTDGTDIVEATTVVTVSAPSIALSESSVTMSLDSGTHTVTVTPSGFTGTPTLTAVSNDTGKATVAVDGLNVVVTPVAEGDTSISVTATKDTQSANASFNVSVIDQTAVSCRLSVSSGSANYLKGDVVADTASTSELATWAAGFFSFTQTKESAANGVVLDQAEIRAYSGHSLTLTPASGVSITSVVFNCSSTSYASALNNSTWSDNVSAHSLPSKSMVVTVQLTNTASSFNVALTSQSRINSIEVNFAMSTAAAKEWATSFNSSLASICSAGENNATPSADLVSAWSSQATSYAALADIQKDYIKAITASVSGSAVAQAMAKYDFIMTKYGTSTLSNFVGRSYASGAGSVLELQENVLPVAVIASLSLLGILATAGVFLLKKKHQ